MRGGSEMERLRVLRDQMVKLEAESPEVTSPRPEDGPSAGESSAPAPDALRTAIVQAKLAVGPMDDPYEREADEMADRVVRSLGGSPGGQPLVDTSPRVQRAASTSVGLDGGTVDADTDRAIASGRGNGSPLPATTRTSMESAFGADFGAVRVHTGPQATELNTRIQAKAFTVGSDIWFRDGLPSSSAEGNHLLAHELTHTLQQSGAAARAVDAPAARVQRLTDRSGVIRRLVPSRADVVEVLGEPKADKERLVGGTKRNSTVYKPVLAAVDAAYNWARGTAIPFATSGTDTLPDVAGIKAGLTTYHRLLDDIDRTARTYVEKKGSSKVKKSQDAKTAYMGRLLSRVARERVFAEQRARKLIREGDGHGEAGGKMWSSILRGQPAGALGAAPAVDLGGVAAGAVHGGGINKVTEFRKDGVHSGFKPEAAPRRLEEMDDREQMTEGAMTYAFMDFEMPFDDPQMAKRDVAMARLDQLLGGGVIARAELATRDGAVGSVMDWSGGRKAGDLRGDFTATGAPATGATPAKASFDDANLQRLVSRLHLIDILAMQADRHVGNFVLHVAAGQVVGVTGIDNDLSFGKRTDITKGKQEMFPVQKFVDEELAERILNLNADDITWALSSLLADGEIKALLVRLAALQAKLVQVKKAGGFLKPAEWTAEVARGMLAEQSRGYFAKVRGKLEGL